MEFTGPYRINGSSYTRSELIDFCRHSAIDPLGEEWYRDLFRFILRFMEETSGPILQQSSGTTGDPKTFSLERRAMIQSARRTLSYFNLQPGEKTLLSLPVDYVAGKMMVVRALVGGLDLVTVKPSSRPLTGISEAFSFAAMVPMQVYESLKSGDDLSLVNMLLVGGGELHPSIRARLVESDRPAVYESFAMTETYTHFAIRQINGSAPEDAFRLLEGVTVDTDERGCLVVDVPGVTKGPVVTNDLVEIEGNGLGFRWLGRADHVINTGGIKVIPELLEQLIGEWLQATCLLLPQPDKKLGQRLVLMVEWPSQDAPLDRWMELLSGHLSPHEVPKQIIPVKKIPRNTNFKP
ncbi:MAG: AMP-binding protein, partial [Bacteroidota bacterium]